jgi:hypothetical protein
MWGALSNERTGLSFIIATGFVSAVILGSESSETRDHILLSQIPDFLFVASYDSQGHSGGIRPRLHTRLNLFFSKRSLIKSPVTMENVYCLSIVKVTRSVPSRPPGIHIFIETYTNFVSTLVFTDLQLSVYVSMENLFRDQLVSKTHSLGCNAFLRNGSHVTICSSGDFTFHFKTYKKDWQNEPYQSTLIVVHWNYTNYTAPNWVTVNEYICLQNNDNFQQLLWCTIPVWSENFAILNL